MELVLVWGYVSVGGVSLIQCVVSVGGVIFGLGICECGWSYFWSGDMGVWAELVLVWGYVSVGGVSFGLGICECGRS